ncbi:MAG: hypothetical protein NTX49_08120 [Chlamydiae bacterium]|nr:hypothetical protein [Chlamydiota bacterium]
MTSVASVAAQLQPVPTIPQPLLDDITSPPAQSSTLSLAARQVAVSVISITDNVARIKIGSKFYDADITEHMPGSSGSMVNKKLAMTQEIAQKVQEQFQTLLNEGVFTADTQEITLSGDANFNFTDIKTLDTAGAATTKKITDLVDGAQTAVTQLSSYLVSQETILRPEAPLTSPTLAPLGPQRNQPHRLQSTPIASPSAHPLAPGSTASPIPPAAAVTAPTPPVATTATRLTEQFLRRATDSSTTPMDHFNQLYGNHDGNFSSKAAKALAKYLTDGISRPHGFAEDQNKLALIKNELQRLAAKDKTSLEDAAKDILKGWWPCRTDAFAPGFIGNMSSGQFDSYDSKDLVKLYANYLVKKGISDKMGEGFYNIFAEFANDPSNTTEFRRDLQIRILGKKGTTEIEQKAIYPTGQPLVPANCIYLLQDGEGNPATFRAYEREAKTGASPLQSIDDFTDTGPAATPQPRAAGQLPQQTLPTMAGTRPLQRVVTS